MRATLRRFAVNSLGVSRAGIETRLSRHNAPWSGAGLSDALALCGAVLNSLARACRFSALLHQRRLLIRIQPSEKIKDLAAVHQPKEPELIRDYAIRVKAGWPGPTLEQSPKLVRSYGLKFRDIVVVTLPHQFDRHFAKSANAIRVTTVIGGCNLA